MAKKVLVLIMVAVLATGVVSMPPVYAGEPVPVANSDAGVTVQVNDEVLNFDVKPRIENGRTLVPVRLLAEALGAVVDYSPSARTVTIWLGEKTVTLAVGGLDAYVNGTKITLDAAPQIVNGRTLVPLRFIAEALGASVEWKPAAKLVSVRHSQMGKEIPFQWYKQVISNGGVNAAFTSEQREIKGDWYAGDYSKYMSFDIVTKQGQAVSMPPLETFASIYPPPNDYERYFIIYAYLGQANTGGHDIKVEKITQRGNQVRVTVRTISPAPGSSVTEVLTYPHEFVRVAKADLAHQSRLHFRFVDQNGKTLGEKDCVIE